MIKQVLRSGSPDAERRSCRDCLHMRAAVSWWCTNDAAVKAHGTRIPGRQGCGFWEPCASLTTMRPLERVAVHLDPNVLLVDPLEAA